MIEKLLVENVVLALPLFVLGFHMKFPGNKITPYLIPKNLADRKCPKNTVLLTTLDSPLGIFFVWIHSILIIRKFHVPNNRKQTT